MEGVILILIDEGIIILGQWLEGKGKKRRESYQRPFNENSMRPNLPLFLDALLV